MKKKKFHCKSEAQLKAIRYNYWLKSQQGKKQVAPAMPPGVKTLGVKGKPIGTIPYDLGKRLCAYADMLKEQDIEQGKTVRPPKYYHNKAWQALNMDEQLNARLAPIDNDFDYTESGYIKGHYTVDGFFEPD